MKTPIKLNFLPIISSLSFLLLSPFSFAEDSDSQPIGQQDTTTDSSRLFLRDSQVLLNKRELQLSIGFNYTSNERLRSFRENRDRSLTLPIGLSYGITDSMEIRATLPLVYNEREVIATNSISDNNTSGIGDASLGLSYKLRAETESSPAVTTSFTVNLPTGDQADSIDDTSLSTGAGFWSTAANLSVSKSIDPAIVYFNLGYRYAFDDKRYRSKALKQLGCTLL